MEVQYLTATQLIVEELIQGQIRKWWQTLPLYWARSSGYNYWAIRGYCANQLYEIIDLRLVKGSLKLELTCHTTRNASFGLRKSYTLADPDFWTTLCDDIQETRLQQSQRKGQCLSGRLFKRQ